MICTGCGADIEIENHRTECSINKPSAASSGCVRWRGEAVISAVFNKSEKFEAAGYDDLLSKIKRFTDEKQVLEIAIWPIR